MTLALSLNDVLSLYTETDGSPQSFPRSVIIHRPKETPKKLFLVDNLTFDVFLSVPRAIDPKELKRHMLNSYCFSHFNRDMGIQEIRATKGSSIDELSNNMISHSLLSLFQDCDEYNDAQFELFAEAMAKKKRPTNYNNIHRNDEGEELSAEEEEEDDEIEDETLALNKLFTGLETPLHMPNASKDNRPDEDQYRLIFRNHYIASFFVKKFENPIKIRTADGVYDPNTPFYIDVLCYEKYNNAGFRAVDKRFTGQPVEYIAGQLHLFKDKNETLSMRLPVIRQINSGLLHPSCCRGDRNTTRQTVPNILENLFTSVSSPFRSKTIPYQTLYIDLSEKDEETSLTLVDYTRRQLVEKPMATAKKRTLDAKPIKNQPGVANFFKKPRLEETV